MANEYQGYSNMMNMQERAAERVRRMQRMEEEAVRRANEELHSPPAERKTQRDPSPSPSPTPPDSGAQRARRTAMPVDYLHRGPASPTGGEPSTGPARGATAPALLGGDQDSAMLLALILLLSRETSDPSLILALMYIMI